MNLSKTPDYGHVYSYPDVYEPAEDTFLLMDALELEYNENLINERKTCLEIGCGSGLVSVYLAKLLDKKSYLLCTDINPSACECTQITALNNNVKNVTVLNTEFTNGLLPRMKNAFDIIIFNPPYVVTPSEEISMSGIAQSWAGGKDGREVMDKFFTLLPDLLSQRGVFYLLIEKQNKPEEIIKMLKKLDLKHSVVKSHRTGPEFLSVVKFSKNV